MKKRDTLTFLLVSIVLIMIYRPGFGPRELEKPTGPAFHGRSVAVLKNTGRLETGIVW